MNDISEVTTDGMKFMHENVKHRKEPGGDGLVTGILKYVDEESIKYYQNYLSSAYRKVCQNFRRAIAALLYKKGDNKNITIDHMHIILKRTYRRTNTLHKNQPSKF